MNARITKIGDDEVTYNPAGKIIQIGSERVLYDSYGYMAKVGSKTVYHEEDKDKKKRIYAIGNELAIYDKDGVLKNIGNRDVSYDSTITQSITTLRSNNRLAPDRTQFPFWGDSICKKMSPGTEQRNNENRSSLSL